MSHGFFDTFKELLSRFSEECRAREFREFLVALAEWRISQIFQILMKEKIYDWGELASNHYNFLWVTLNREENEINADVW